MTPFANMMNLFAHEFARLGGGRLPFRRILARTLERLLFRHGIQTPFDICVR
jgi:hypothetical protein